MTVRRVRFLARAVSDLIEIGQYLSVEAPQAQERLLGAIVAAGESLGPHGEKGPVARDPILARKGYRSLREGRYVLFYRLTPTTVRIHRVLHERRSWARLLR